MIKAIRRWWRRRFEPDPPMNVMPSIGWWHTRMCIGGVPMQQAIDEERAWAQNSRRRWLDGEKM